MSIKKYGLLSSSVLYGLGGVAQRLIGLITLPVFTRFLTPADYGVVGLLSALPALLLPIFTLGLTGSISVCYFSTKRSNGRSSVIQTSRWITYLSTSVMMALTFAELDSMAQLLAGSVEFRVHTLVAIVTVAFSVLSLPLQLELQFSERPLEFVVISFVGAVLTSVFSTLAIVWLRLGALGLLMGGLLGQASVWVMLLVRKRNDVRGAADSEIAKELLQHGLPLLPSFLLLFILQNSVRWILESSHGIGEVGLYSIGSNFGSMLALVTSGFVTAWMPWAMRLKDSWEEGRHIVAKRLTQYAIGMGFVVLLFFCAAQPMLWITTPHDYFEAWVVVGLAATTSFMMSLFSLLLPPLYMAGKVPLVLIPQGVAAFITLSCAYFLINFGALGASASVMLGSVSLVAVQLLVNAKLTDRKPMQFEVKRLIVVTLALGVSCYATFWLEIDHLNGFVIRSMMLIIMAGWVLYKCFPDGASLLRRFSRGI